MFHVPFYGMNSNGTAVARCEACTPARLYTVDHRHALLLLSAHLIFIRSCTFRPEKTI